MNRGYSWVFSPGNIKPSKQLIAHVEGKLAEIVEIFKREHVKEAPSDNKFNYILDIYQKRRGRFFYLCAKFRCPAGNCITEFFDLNFVRLECYTNNTFNLAYMRHNDEWNDPYRELDLDSCIEMIKTDELFHP